MSFFAHPKIAFAFLLATGAAVAMAQTWSVETIETRATQDGQRVRVNVATHLPVNGTARHVVLSPLSSGTSAMKPGASSIGARGPWAGGAATFAQGQVALVYLDAPSDAGGRNLAQRRPEDVQEDVQAAVDLVRKRFPGVPVHLGAFSLTGQALDAVARVQGLSRLIVASGNFLDDRDRSFKHIPLPMLFVHASTAQCDAAPVLEAEHLARAHGYPLVRVGYARLEATAGCGPDSQHALRGVEPEFARAVIAWLDGASPPAEIGSTPARAAWSEQIVHYQVPGVLGGPRLEMTLLLPEGKLPVPVVVFNHGDVEVDHSALRYKRRIREMTVAREFLRLGVAVALPARRGVALSEGTYPRSFKGIDGDPTYKARVHAQDILPALDLLRGRPEIDPERILLAGQSAGGYSASYLASTSPKGVIGVVNFSGGRTDMTSGAGPGYLNKMMVDGFAELGRTTKVPALFIFAEGDSRYSPQTIRASYEAFVAAGGQGRLMMSPSTGRDGHLVHLVPQQWAQALKEFLAQLRIAE